jgi:ABC-2 type transport system ATP-binding protein
MIVARALTKHYGDHTAIDRIDFSVPEGAIAGFLGPNGAGKSTTMRILAGALAASSGSAHVGGHDVFEEPLRVKRLLGYLPEQPPLYDDMTVEGYLEYAAELKRTEAPRSAARQAMDRVGLGHVGSRLIGHLSKGYRQRVGVAQALVHQPRVLLLDEPTSGLDPAQRVQMRALVRELAAGGVTVVLSTHVLPEVEAICDHVVLIHGGRVLADAPLREVAARDGVRLRVQRPDGLPERLRALPGVREVSADALGYLLARAPADLTPAIARLAAEHELVELGTAGGLEEAFLRLTAGAP